MRLITQKQRTNYLREFFKEKAALKSESNPHGLRDSPQSVMQYSLDVTNGKCIYCGEQISHRNKNGKWEKTGNDGDHLYPISKGAPYMEGEVVYCCKECNKKKDDKDPIEFLSYLHATNPPEKLFIADFNDHVDLLLHSFIDHFIHDVPDQILKIMGSDSGVSETDIDLIEKLDQNPDLMTFTPDIQDKFIARSLAYKKEVNEAHKELFMFSFNVYDEELKKLGESKGKNYREQFYASYTMFDWLVRIPEELGLDPDDVLNMDKVIEDHKDDTDPEMRIASSVQDFMRPVMLSLRQHVAEVREDYEEKLQAWRDSGEVGPEPSDQSASVYNHYCRSWNLFMKSYLKSGVAQGDADKTELIRNSILPPTQAGLNQLLDLPDHVDPVLKLRFTASMLLDDKKDMDYMRISLEDDGEENVLDLSGWLPRNLPFIKGMYESRREQQSTITGVKKRAKSHNLLSWSFKDDLLIRILLAGNDLVDENGNLSTQAFAIALFEKLREEVLIRNDNGVLKLPNSNSTNYSSVRTLFNSLDALSSIVLGQEIPREIKESMMTKLIQDEAALSKFIEDNNDSRIESLDLEIQSMDDDAYSHFLEVFDGGNYSNLSMSQIIAGTMRMWNELAEVEDRCEDRISSLQEELNRTSEELNEKNKELEITKAQLDVLWKVIEKSNIKLQNQ